jgi:vancomycin resistance protein YoaR
MTLKAPLVTIRTQQHDDRKVVDPFAVESAKPSPRRRPGLVAAVVVGSLLVIATALYLIGYFVTADRLPRKAVVSGVPIGGLTEDQAVEKLTTGLGPRAKEPIQITVGERKADVRPTDAGLQVDYVQSVTTAGGGHNLDPRRILAALTGGSAVNAVVRTDQAKLSATVAGLATTFDQKPENASLSYAGAKIKKTAAQTGLSLRREAAETSIQHAFLTTTGPVSLAADVTQPDITDAEVAAVVKGFAAPAVSGPVTVKAGGAGKFVVTPAMIGESITFQPENGTLAPVLDPKALIKNAAKAVKKVELTKPRDATVRLVKGKPKVIPAVDGTTVAAADLAKAVEPVLIKSGDDRTASVQLTGDKAEFSTADAKKLGIKHVTGEFTTYYPYLPYRNINIGRAAELINGTLLKPGEIFSLNGVVGERTRANGFTEGFIIKGGRFREELGGGVSQSATTTFNAMFFAGLKDIQHQPHGLFIDRYPPGREATVAWPSLDLKFQNDTKYGVLVQAFRVKGDYSHRGSITVRMWSTKTYDKVVATKPVETNFTSGKDVKDDSAKCVPMDAVSGFDVSYQRLFYKGGAVVRRENFHWHYSPTDHVTCTKK